MKSIVGLFVAAFFSVILYSCKKDDTPKPATVNAGNNQTPNISEAITGKWFITKDSIQTLDYYTVIPNLVKRQAFGNNDFIVFNKDSTAVISNTAAFNAFYTDYEASNTDSKLRVNTYIIPNLSFKYKIILEGYGITSSTSQSPPQAVYGLGAENLVALKSVGYGITMPSATNLVLEHDLEIPTLQHDYKIKEYIYLKK